MSDHREYAAGLTVSIHYWKGSVASDRDSADRAVIYGRFQHPSVEFLRNDGHPSAPWWKLDKTLLLIEAAYEAGKRDKLKEIREFLGVKEPRL